MASGSLGKLTIDLAANISKFEKSLTRAEQLAENRSRAIQRTFTRLGTGIGGALASFGFAAAVKNSLDFADAIGKAADRAGIGTQKLQELRFAADQFGISTQQMDDGLRRFTRRLGVALDGGSFAKDFENLGVAIRDVNGNTRSSEAVFNDVAVAMGKLGSAAEKSKVAAQLFGDDAGPQLALLLGQGKGAIDALAAEARSLGIILSDDVVRGAEAANDELSKIQQVVKIGATQAFASLAPEIERTAKVLQALVTGDASRTPDFLKDVSYYSVVAAKEFADLADWGGAVAAILAKLFAFEFSAIPVIIAEREKRREQMELELKTYREYLDAVGTAPDLPELIRPTNTETLDNGGAKVNYFTQLTDQEMDDQLTAAMDMQNQLDAFYEESALKRAATEQRYNDAVYAARSDAFNRGVDLLRRFASENETIARILIILQTAKAVKDIQINAAATSAQVLAYGQVEAAAHRALFNYPAAAAAIARASAAAASINAAAQVSTAIAVATGVADFAGVGSTGGTGGATAPLGSVGNPITTNEPVAPTPINTGNTSSGTITINVNGVVTEEVMQSVIIPAIQDAANDKDIILFRSDSRQAIELTA